jgi:hypothetical protein
MSVSIWYLTSIRNFRPNIASKDTIKKVKGKSTEREKYLQITYLIRIYYLEYIKIPYNLTTQSRNG